jgi:hypothetical protein
MAMKGAVLALVVCAGSAGAGEMKMGEAGIRAALVGQRLVYADGTAQSFDGQGGTVFFAAGDGAQSLGHWQVRAGQYCSVWPPSDVWACYDVLQDATTVAFVAADGNRSVGQVQP